MNQIERIEKMEKIMDRVGASVRTVEKALQEFAQLEEDIDTLNSYYMDGQWRNDFEADEKGKLPKNLKRGVLSEDALFDLLEETDRLRNLLIAMDEED